MSDVKAGKIFIKGLLFTLPILLTLAFCIWAVQSIEAFLSKPLEAVIPNHLHFSGMGILVAFVLIYIIGLAIHGRVLEFFFNWLQSLMKRLPVISAVYQNLKEMIDFVSGEKDSELERVVLVSVSEDIRLIGFVTKQDVTLSSSTNPPLHAVYLPMSYQMGGYLVYVPDSRMETIQISKREAMQRILTADIGTSSSNQTS